MEKQGTEAQSGKGTKFMTYYGGSYVAKNQLERDQVELFESKDRILIEGFEGLERFKENTITELNRINQKNFRCNPMKPSWHKTGSESNDLFISGIRVVRFHIYEIKQIQG